MAERMMHAEDVIWRRIEDDIVVIKDDGLSVNVLNKTAAIIWESCEHGAGIGEIVTRLCDRFDVSSEEASADIRVTIEKLKLLGLIVESMETSGQ